MLLIFTLNSMIAPVPLQCSVNRLWDHVAPWNIWAPHLSCEKENFLFKRCDSAHKVISVFSSETGLTCRGWCQPLRPNSSWIEQVKTCSCLTQLEERRSAIPKPDVPFQIKHHGTGGTLMNHLSTMSSGQKWDFPSLYAMIKRESQLCSWPRLSLIW